MAAIRKLLALASSLAAGAGALAYIRYRNDIRAITAAVETGSEIAVTDRGPIEYAVTGEGEPLLVIHGAGGGYDQGLLIARDLGEGFRVIAPSRFGYLRTPVPDDPSPQAQADAHACLLDHLDVPKAIVLGVSAGAPSAIEFALRYPERTQALILLVPRAYDPAQSVGVDETFRSQAVLRLVEASSDFLFWLATRSARSSVVRFLGVPPEVEAHASAAERDRVTEVIRSILPLSRRVKGISADSTTTLSEWPLERLAMPVLIVSAKDDLFKTLPAARYTAAHIPQAELKVLRSGGHLMIGQGETIRGWVNAFLGKSAPTATPPADE